MRLVRQPTTTYTVAFRVAVPVEMKPANGVPRVTRRLALAHKIDRQIREGHIRDLADAARRLGLTRARVTQITNLLLLAPAIQEAVLDLPHVEQGRDLITERSLQRIVAEPNWNLQLQIWKNGRKR